MGDGMPLAPTEDSVFVVSGGGRGITAHCAIGLADRFRCAFGLLGRSPVGETEPAWSRGFADEAELKARAADDLRAAGARPTPPAIQRGVDTLLASRAVADTLAGIARAGGRGIYLQADVGDPDAVGRAVDAVTARFGPVSGLVHGAGTLADRLVQHKTAADYAAVVRPKVDGLTNLLRYLPPSQLRHVVLFSSAAAYYGNAGQADYALANEALNKAAHALQRAYPACQVLAIDWGPWAGGMVGPALGRLFRERGVQLIEPDAGAQLLADLLASPPRGAVQVLAGASWPATTGPPPVQLPHSAQVSRRLTLVDNPFLADHVLDGHVTLPLAAVVAWLANTAEQLWSGFRARRIESLRVLKGVVFDGPSTAAADFVLELTEAARSGDQIRLDATLTGGHAGSPTWPRYRAGLVLARGAPPEPGSAPLVPSGEPLADGPSLYGDGTLFHGPRFQGLRQVRRLDEAGLAAECTLAEVPVRDQGQIQVQRVNPFALDLAFQVLTVWTQRRRGSASLPTRVESIELICPIPWGQLFYVSLAIRSAGADTVVGDVVLHDLAGQVLCRLRGVEHAISPRLNERFRRNQLAEPLRA